VLLPTVIVIVDLPEPGFGIGLGWMLTVVCEGTPEAESVMALLKPPLMAVVIVDAPCLPCGMRSEDGEAEMVKLGDVPATVSVRIVLCWVPPPLPVTVIGYVPTGVPLPTIIVIAEAPAPGAGMTCGLKVTLVPAGKPDAEKLIALLKPPLIAVVIPDAPPFPWGIVNEDGDAETVKDACC